MEENGKNVLTEELIAEQKIVGNQGLMRTIYKFRNDKAVYCINITEFYDNEFAQIAYDANKKMPQSMYKNIVFDGKILQFEWSDTFFEKKGKGDSKAEIEQFLKQSGWKIKHKKQ